MESKDYWNRLLLKYIYSIQGNTLRVRWWPTDLWEPEDWKKVYSLESIQFSIVGWRLTFYGTSNLLRLFFSSHDHLSSTCRNRKSSRACCARYYRFFFLKHVFSHSISNVDVNRPDNDVTTRASNFNWLLFSDLSLATEARYYRRENTTWAWKNFENRQQVYNMSDEKYFKW